MITSIHKPNLNMMNNLVKSILTIVIALYTLCLNAQEFNYQYQYNVKFICGYSNGQIIGPGTYHTAINVLNPNLSIVHVQYYISEALQGKPGLVSTGGSFKLDSLQSIEIDCPQIRKRIHSNYTFNKGFVLIRSDQELEIVAVYTATGRGKKLESIHTERVSTSNIQMDDNTIQEPSNCADFSLYITDNKLGPKFDDELGMQLISLGTNPALKRLYGSCFVFEPEGIRLTWSPDARGELLITISQISGLRSEPVPKINAYNASGGVVGSGFTEGFSGWKRFRVDLDRAERIDITGGYHDPSKNYVYCLSSICVRDPQPAREIVEGATFNSYLIKDIIDLGAPDGEYTFRQYDCIDNPEHLFYVHLFHNGTEVLQLAYNWQTTISFDDPYRFSFPGYFDIDIARAYSGTQNLHGLKYSLFDGRQTLNVSE